MAVEGHGPARVEIAKVAGQDEAIQIVQSAVTAKLPTEYRERNPSRFDLVRPDFGTRKLALRRNAHRARYIGAADLGTGEVEPLRRKVQRARSPEIAQLNGGIAVLPMLQAEAAVGRELIAARPLCIARSLHGAAAEFPQFQDARRIGHCDVRAVMYGGVRPGQVFQRSRETHFRAASGQFPGAHLDAIPLHHHRQIHAQRRGREIGPAHVQRLDCDIPR